MAFLFIEKNKLMRLTEHLRLRRSIEGAFSFISIKGRHLKYYSHQLPQIFANKKGLDNFILRCRVEPLIRD